MHNFKQVDIVGVQIDLGASSRGVNMGPAAIRHAGLIGNLRKRDIVCHDLGDIVPEPTETEYSGKLRNFNEVYDTTKALYETVKKSMKSGSLPVILGGDHSVAAGSVTASVSHHGEIGLLWIDAHGDFNDEQSSPSGNMHGMPLSAVCGLGPDTMVDFGEGMFFVKPQNVVLIGQRDIDDEEKARLRKSGATVLTISEIDRLGMAKVIEKALDLLRHTAGIHISFDIDVITPEEAPGVGTPVHSGITVREAFLAAELLAEKANIIAVDMVEVNPILDIKNKTGNLASELIQSLLGKTVY